MTNLSYVKTDLSDVVSIAKKRPKLADVAAKNDESPPDDEGILIGKRIGLLVDYLGIDKSVDVTGKSARQLKRYGDGAEPPLKVLRSLCEAAKVSFDWLIHGNPTTLHDSILRIEELRDELSELNANYRNVDDLTEEQTARLHEERRLIREMIALENERSQILRRREDRKSVFDDVVSETISELLDSANVETKEDVDRLISIPVYTEIRPAAGAGASASNTFPSSVVAFDRNWLRDLGVNPSFAKILFADGDSMHPTIRDGAPMLVDTSKTEIRHGCIYVFDLDGDLMVKRIERLPDGTIDLISDNRTVYPVRNISRDRLDLLHVVGRVFLTLRTF